ncbi:hypothetical protein QZH41_012550 [Actinostola sp. cb2023]|nr:hypothetical protein QZH41_012550 [Actinostola sp. cb2023]
MYAESSFPRKQGDRARVTAYVNTKFPACFYFHYHMYGKSMGTLRVYLNRRLVWQLQGNQGNQWIKATFPVYTSGLSRLDFDAIIGPSFTSDIALDDLGYQEYRYLSSCTVTPSCAKPGNQPTPYPTIPPMTYPPFNVTSAPLPSNGTYDVVVGDHNRTVHEGFEQRVSASQIFVHPNWNRSNIDSDIALVHLSRPVFINYRVRPVCLPQQDEYVPSGSKCYITGWGKIRHPGGSHDVLQQAVLPVVSKQRCQQKLSNSTGMGSRWRITDNMICGGEEGSIKSGCHGDSGGPFVCQARDGRWVLQGAVSWGSSRCDAKQRYTVFSRVGRFRNWIDNHMRRHGR